MVANNHKWMIETVHGVKHFVGVKRMRPIHILVVDDCMVNRTLLTTMLEKELCTYETAENGKQGLECFERRQFDLVFMDIEMPVMDGLTAIGEIRRWETTRAVHTPLVALTSGVPRDRCLAAGADLFVEKPIRLETLQSLIAELPSRRAS